MKIFVDFFFSASSFCALFFDSVSSAALINLFVDRTWWRREKENEQKWKQIRFNSNKWKRHPLLWLNAFFLVIYSISICLSFCCEITNWMAEKPLICVHTHTHAHTRTLLVILIDFSHMLFPCLIQKIGTMKWHNLIQVNLFVSRKNDCLRVIWRKREEMRRDRALINGINSVYCSGTDAIPFSNFYFVFLFSLCSSISVWNDQQKREQNKPDQNQKISHR